MSNLAASIDSYALLTNTPNFLGMLYESNIRKTQFLSVISGKSGQRTMITKNPEFSTGVEYSLEDPSQPAITENQALSPQTPKVYALSQNTNVVQIFQTDTGVSRLRERSRRLEGINTSGDEAEETSEIARQIELQIKFIARQINFTAINGKFDSSGLTNSNVALKTRGILECIETNVIDGLNKTTTDEQIKDQIDELFRMVYDKGMFAQPMLVVNSLNKVKITRAYKETGLAEVPLDRFTAGLNVQSIVTNFSNTGVYVIIDNDMPNTVILLADIDYIRPVFTRDVKTKEIILVHPLSQRGGNLYEIYAEFGLDHGPEMYHGKIKNFGVTNA